MKTVLGLVFLVAGDNVDSTNTYAARAQVARAVSFSESVV